ncbi:cobalamin biosynthesis protein CobD [Candidatus Poribacteria bacterium]|nr:cobalamin biosynthesis protein CobD [Candidatus Poribacteria bacterium]
MTIIITSAFTLDLILGDPGWLPHPVRGIGWLITKLEPHFRELIKNIRLAGVLFWVVIISIVWGLTYFIIKEISFINENAGSVFSILFIYTTIAIKDLKDESMMVYYALENNDIESARKNLSYIVGRDTHNLDEKEIIRAAVETIAENSVDGIISPLFYAFIGGAPLALAYKAINTLDSMVGYKNEKYISFGWASARLDDLFNYIPSRISAMLIPIASWMIGKDGKSAWRIALRDGDKNPSPNSGIPEAAVAGALGIQLGGLNYYNNMASLKPYIGNKIYPLERKYIKESIEIIYIFSTLFIIVGIFLSYLILSTVIR